ncbi:hypothetical protein [Caenimonas sp. SL110]|uniref:hypothetical protein n=1 Tax=Caenimonas sp. SL110 TaxID=1450524 RepID=UPI00128B0F81|nr:hypothetical protein [Caenimonas sp. SL110]
MQISFMVPPHVSKPYVWLVEMDGRRLGINDRHEWQVESLGKVSPLNNEQTCILAIPVLEADPRKFYSFLKGLTPTLAEAAETFPLEMVLKVVFHTSFSGYWPQRALEWLGANEAPVDKLESELRSFSINKAMPQKARQTAYMLVRRSGV